MSRNRLQPQVVPGGAGHTASLGGIRMLLFAISVLLTDGCSPPPCGLGLFPMSDGSRTVCCPTDDRPRGSDLRPPADTATVTGSCADLDCAIASEERQAVAVFPHDSLPECRSPSRLDSIATALRTCAIGRALSCSAADPVPVSEAVTVTIAAQADGTARATTSRAPMRWFSRCFPLSLDYADFSGPVLHCTYDVVFFPADPVDLSILSDAEVGLSVPAPASAGGGLDAHPDQCRRLTK